MAVSRAPVPPCTQQPFEACRPQCYMPELQGAPPEVVARSCGILAMGKSLELRRLEATERDARINSLEERLERVSIDPTTQLFTRSGIRDRSTYDRQFIHELTTNRNWGIAFKDIRGLKHLNDTYGQDAGDRYIQIASVDLSRHLFSATRHRIERPQKDFRRAPYDGEDVLGRWGGDEFMAIILNVSPEELFEVASRIGSAFIVGNAKQACQEGRLPIIAGVGSAHISQIEAGTNLFSTIKRLCDIADTTQKTIKHTQYDAMWDEYLATLSAYRRRRVRRPSEERDIYQLFIESCCPNLPAIIGNSR